MSEDRARASGPRARRTGAGAACLLFLLAGCGAGDAMPTEEAVTHHQTVAEDLLEAFDSVRPLSWEHRSQKIIEPGAEDCRYQAGVWESEEPLYPEPGGGMDWEPWRDAVDPVLEEHGFDALGREKRSGAELRVESEGPHGARVVLRADGALVITDISVDADPCADSVLGP